MLLLEYRDVINKSKDVDDEMLCIEKILKFYRSEFNRSDLYTEYIYKLYEIHFKSKNFTEAAFTLLEHANRTVWQSNDFTGEWSSAVLGGKSYPIRLRDVYDSVRLPMKAVYPAYTLSLY